MKRVLSFILVAALLLSTAAPVFAAEEEGTGETKTAAQKAAEATPPLTEAKSLSLQEAIEIMTTTGTRAEAAALSRKSDKTVAEGYSEKVSKIKKTMDTLNATEQQIKLAQAAGYPADQIAAMQN